MMALHPTKDVMKSGSYSILSRTTENGTGTQEGEADRPGLFSIQPSLRVAHPWAPANKRRLILILLYYI